MHHRGESASDRHTRRTAKLESVEAAVPARPQDHQAPPRSSTRKEAIRFRTDRDAPAAYRRTGSGWQTRIRADPGKSAPKALALITPRRGGRR
ncbi:MAG: BrnA antitoxin family protein [Bradyrhizobium sp.]|nr:BrnA antitoxin family protein [Bradyrhizobium sp.]